jgi:hypothetical protein
MATVEHMFEERAPTGMPSGCPDLEHCTGHALRVPVDGAGRWLPGPHRLSWAELPCPLASELHELRAAPVSMRSLLAVARTDSSRITGPEQADLLRLAARAAVWAGQRRDDVAVAVADAVPAVRMCDDAGPVLVDEPGAEEVAVALRCSLGSARWQLRDTRARRVRAPGLVEALRRGDSGLPQARELDRACAELTDEGATEVADRCHRTLLTGTRQQVARVARRQVAGWHASHPQPAPEAGADQEQGAPAAAPPDPRAGRNVEAFPSTVPGMVAIFALLPAEDAAALMARLETAIALAKAAGDPRTADQVAADTLAAFGWHGLPHDDLLDLLRHHAAAEAAEAAAAGAATGATATAGGGDARSASGATPAEDLSGAPTAGSNPRRSDHRDNEHRDHDHRDVQDTRGAASTPPAGSAERWPTDDPGGAASAPDRPPPTAPPRVHPGLDPALLAALHALRRSPLTGTVTAQVHVTMGLATLLGLRAAPADLATAAPGHRGSDLGPVPADAARRLAARPDALWDRFLHDQNGVLQGISPSYHIPDTLRRTVLAEYQTCTAFGCVRPAADCDIDHVDPWHPDGSGGRTTHANLHPADRRHHNVKTHGGWRVTRGATGTITWTSPLGQSVTVRPHDYRGLEQHC